MPLLLLVLLALSGFLLTYADPVRAQDDGLVDACSAEVAKLRNIDPASMRFAAPSASEAGYVQLPFRTISARGACVFAPTGQLIDVRFSGGTERWDGAATGSISSQQSACAGEFARRFNLPLASATITDIQPTADGGQTMVVGAQEIRAMCSANSFNAVTMFEVLRDE